MPPRSLRQPCPSPPVRWQCYSHPFRCSHPPFPLAYLPFTNDEVKNKEIINQQVVPNVNPGVMADNKVNNDIDQLVIDTTNIIQNLKIINKKVEISTKITYTFDDGSTKVVTQNETHEFKN